MKKTFALVLVICLIITLSPFQVIAANDSGQLSGGMMNSTELSENEFPASFDLRDKGVVTPVKQQEPFGDCWAHAAIAASEISILTAMGSTYADTGLDLSERHLAWYVTSPVTENISKSQAGEGLHVYNTDAGVNHVFDFGGREQCAATLFAQGIGPVPEQDYPCRGAEGRLALDDLREKKEAYIEQRMAVYRDQYMYRYFSDDMLRSFAEDAYKEALERYEKFDVYSPLDDWSINEPDEPGSGRLKTSPYTLTDNNVFNYWALLDNQEITELGDRYAKPIYDDGTCKLYQDSIDQLKKELYEGRGISVGVTISDDCINFDNWAVYDSSPSIISEHVVCIVGWDDDYAASNFTHIKDSDGEVIWDDEEMAAELTTPPGNGAWIVKNSWGSETDLVPGGLTAADGTAKDANGGSWGIKDSQGNHTGYFYLSYYDGTIHVPESFKFEIEENNDQQYALQHDYLPASVTEFIIVEESPMWEANVFTLDKDMRIDEVATRIRMSEKIPVRGFKCTFDLYKLNEGATKPDDGELISTATRMFESEGYHRTALDAPVYLKAGDRLGIVVQQSHTFDNGTTAYCIEAQEADSYRQYHSDPVYATPVFNEGESFWKSEIVTSREEASRDGWLDMTAPLSKELLLTLKPDLEDNPYMLDFFLEESVGKPISEVFYIDNFCIKAFGEPYTPAEACPKDDTCPITPFTDTDKNAWYHNGVHWALERGVVNGTGKNTFEPLNDTTRAMFVTMLWKMEGRPVVNYEMTFKDVSEGKWYSDAIRWAASKGIVTGFNENEFGTSRSVTREQLATILYRYAQTKGSGFVGNWAFPLNFEDADQVSGWANEAMHWMVMNGTIQGVSKNKLSPDGKAVRAQAATILMRYSETGK